MSAPMIEALASRLAGAARSLGAHSSRLGVASHARGLLAGAVLACLPLVGLSAQDQTPAGLEPSPPAAADTDAVDAVGADDASGGSDPLSSAGEPGAAAGAGPGETPGEVAVGQVPGADLSLAVQAYREGRYALAFELFAALAAAEPDQGRRAVLHADAGTAAGRAERFGEAVWHLHEALRASPRDTVAQRNLDLVNLRLGSGRTSSEDLTETLVRLPLVLTLREAHLAGTGLLTVALLLVVLRRLGVGGRGLRITAGLALTVALAWWAVDTAARELDARRAIVLESTAVHGEPSDQGKLLFHLDPGTQVLHEEQRADWVLVETLGGGRGWLPAGAVRRASNGG